MEKALLRSPEYSLSGEHGPFAHKYVLMNPKLRANSSLPIVIPLVAMYSVVS
jgi:hypothetical protein